jgi:hypothetical protein
MPLLWLIVCLNQQVRLRMAHGHKKLWSHPVKSPRLRYRISIQYIYGLRGENLRYAFNRHRSQVLTSPERGIHGMGGPQALFEIELE